MIAIPLKTNKENSAVAPIIKTVAGEHALTSRIKEAKYMDTQLKILIK